MTVIFRKNLRIIILLSSITLITANKAHPPPRSVNVALETSFLFDPKDLNQNKYFVSDIREFLDKLLMVIDPQKPRDHFRTQSKRRDTKQKLELENKTGTGTSIQHVFEFVKNVGQTFVNLTGNKIAEAVSNMHVELITEASKTKHKGTTAIPEETKDNKHVKKGIKSIISTSINKWMRRYPEEMRTIMNSTVNGTNPLIKRFARRINNYYNDEDIKKLNKLLKKFKTQIENNQDTSKTANELLQNAVFKKYGSLNDTTKLALIEDLKMCSQLLLSNIALTKRSLPNHEIETGKIRNIDDITHGNLRRSIDNKLRDTEENEKMETETNEIVVDSAEFLDRTARKS